MSPTRLALIFVLLLTSVVVLRAQEPPQMPTPAPEHKWLERFAGDWTSESEIFMNPTQPAIKATGTETCKMLGDFWLVSEGTGNMGGMTMNHRLTLGYDPATKKYIGTWVDSMTSHLWVYEGTVDESGKKLTLEASGPCPIQGKVIKFRDVTEFKSDTERTFTSSSMGEDGKWVNHVKGVSRKK